jgi:hypothetical protein
VTSNGLCNSHGHCNFDPAVDQPRCFCNEGYSGDNCATRSTSSSPYDGLSVQLGLMATLLVVALILIGVMGYMAYRIKGFREEQKYGSLSTGMEMVDQY